MLFWKCAICGRKKSRFIKKQKASGILSSVTLKTPSSKIQLFGNILLFYKYKMNEINFY